MSTNATSTVKRRDWRTIVFIVVAGIVALLELTELPLLMSPWAPLDWYWKYDPRVLNPELHRWHDAMWGALTSIHQVGILLSLLWRPREKPLLVQYIALVIVITALIVLPFEPYILLPLLFFAAVVAAYPAPRALLDFSREGPFSRPLLALSLVAALLLAPYMGRLLLWQIQGVGGEHATAVGWISDVDHTALLLLAAFLASTKRPGWRTLGILTGVVFLYLGVAALALPNHAGSWGIVGGVLSMLGGLAFIAATLWESRMTMGARAPKEA